MTKYTYGEFPTMEEIKRDYNELMGIIKDIKTIEQAKQLEKDFTIEINGMSIEEFLMPDSNGYVCTGKDIEWIRYEVYGCLSYVYQRLDNGKIWFDVWCDYCYDEFIRDITIDKLTEELYETAKVEVLKM